MRSECFRKNPIDVQISVTVGHALGLSGIMPSCKSDSRDKKKWYLYGCKHSKDLYMSNNYERERDSECNVGKDCLDWYNHGWVVGCGHWKSSRASILLSLFWTDSCIAHDQEQKLCPIVIGIVDLTHNITVQLWSLRLTSSLLCYIGIINRWFSILHLLEPLIVSTLHIFLIWRNRQFNNILKNVL
jgi:hypothetical protein